MEQSRTVYKSRIDLWLVLVLAVALASTLYAAFELFLSASWLTLLLVAPGVVLPLWVLNTRYVLSDGLLRIRSGPFRWEITIHEITGISPSRNLLSSPALSLDRLRIDYGSGRFVLVSPYHKADFISHLERLRGSSR